jgi:DNA-binding XRE family transcriptional regulator
MAQLRREPQMTIEDVAEYLDVSRGTAVTDRREAKQRIAAENSGKQV